MRVLVTGGAGFIGHHLVEKLLWRGDQVIALDDLSTGSRENLEYVEDLFGFRFVHGSALDPELVHRLVEDADAVIHLAPVSASIVLAAAALRTRRTILALTSSPSDADGVEEDERGVLELAVERGLPMSAVRLSRVVGPTEPAHSRSLLTEIVEQALSGDEIVIPGAPSSQRSFVYVEDVVWGLISVLEHHDAWGHVYTLGSHEMVSHADLARLVTELTGTEASVRFVDSADAPPAFSPDLSEAQRVFGYEPKWSVVDTVRAVVAWQRGEPIPPPHGFTSVREIEIDERARATAKPRISVVVPVYNEERLIAECIRRIRSQEVVDELVVVDDGSSDSTREELKQVADFIDHLIFFPENRGKGAAIQAGAAKATGEILVFQDSDLELDPADIPFLAAPILSGEADIVLGTRMHDDNVTVVPKKQWLANLAVTRFANTLYKSRFTDVATAARALPRSLWMQMDLESDRFGIEAEIAAKAARLGARMHEIPIAFRPRSKREGKKLRLKDGVVAGKALVQYTLWRPLRPYGRVRPPAAGPLRVHYALPGERRGRGFQEPVRFVPVPEQRPSDD